MNRLARSLRLVSSIVPELRQTSCRSLSISSCTHMDAKLFTPGPLGVSLSTKQAMLQDVGSRDPSFVELVSSIRKRLVHLAGVSTDTYTCVPMQGSGTFSIEAVLSTTVPREKGKVLILENGAYGRRQADICRVLGIQYHKESFPERESVSVSRVSQLLQEHGDFTHVAVVHCETSSGIMNPIKDIGRAIKDHSKDSVYFVDAMSSFGGVPFAMDEFNVDYMVSSANKCIQGVPGFAYAIANTAHLMSCKGVSRSLSLDLVSQLEGLDKNGQFRFTPPTHALLAFQTALDELDQEGGVRARAERYKNNRAVLGNGMKAMGFTEFLQPQDAGYIITSFLMPQHPKFDFAAFYNNLFKQGYVIYPGKLLDTDCFRLGNIGDLHESDMKGLLKAIQEACQDMGVELPLSS